MLPHGRLTVALASRLADLQDLPEQLSRAISREARDGVADAEGCEALPTKTRRRLYQLFVLEDLKSCSIRFVGCEVFQETR